MEAAEQIAHCPLQAPKTGRKPYGGDGHAIVFDDSFEHHVRHEGDEDRYVLFAILKHPDVEEGVYG